MDLEGHLTEVELVEALNLDYITDNEWKVIGTSALTGKNVHLVAEWLVQRWFGPHTRSLDAKYYKFMLDCTLESFMIHFFIAV